MRDLFFETLAVQRMALMSRLVSTGDCGQEDKEIAMGWIAELSADLLEVMNDSDSKRAKNN
ncbi:hypothetical protein J1785_04350 [Rahnella sp. SL6]|uniref:hypothetical protein n=1 Tax=Rahnella perminowiae TaxID=2816244 RepID=UPI001C27779F|nr:hypothetical protein [Rahnella perminowiae]MBU9808986.1 hypothetical protein [Rahnella perminowiae]